MKMLQLHITQTRYSLSVSDERTEKQFLGLATQINKR